MILPYPSTITFVVSENKVLTHPSSVDSITTSAGQEDHVSMGGFAARKALEVVRHVEQVLAIELLAACQALEFHRPRKTTAPLEEVYKLVRTVAKYVAVYIVYVHTHTHTHTQYRTFFCTYHRPWDKDRYFSPDVNAVTTLLGQGKVRNCRLLSDDLYPIPRCVLVMVVTIPCRCGRWSFPILTSTRRSVSMTALPPHQNPSFRTVRGKPPRLLTNNNTVVPTCTC